MDPILTRVLQSNTKWPIIIVGMVANPAPNATIISATISERDLNTNPMVIKQNLVIDGLDKIPNPDQAKFITLLKDRRIGTHKIPMSTRIIIPVLSADKISEKIKKLVLIYYA